jgi:hypothetical protein
MTAIMQMLLSGTASAPAGPPLANLVGWWDASVTASLTLSGSDVTSIADQSGNGKTLTAVGGGSPTYSATGFNSKPGLTFSQSGTTKALHVSSFPMGTGNTATIFFVGTRAGASSSYVRYISYVGSGQSDDWQNAGSFAVSGVGSNVNQIMWQRNSSNVAGSISSGNRIVIATVASSGAMTLYVDGSSVATVTIAGNWISNGVLDICREASSAFAYADTTLAEWGISTDFTNSTGVTTLYNSLKTKWGL